MATSTVIIGGGGGKVTRKVEVLSHLNNYNKANFCKITI